ncbi:MAG: response regulator [Candidatus Omnitrophica bacterium]|nr:response regulator [Candidatus Omnitrophota bacterium]
MPKVLIVDDEEILLNNLKSYLERKGYIVECILNGEDGLELIKEKDFDILLLDLHLKEGPSGLEVLKLALKIKPELKVVVFTGYGQDKDIEETCFSLGAKGFLKKPLSLSQLKEELERIK